MPSKREKKNPLLKALKYFWGPIPWMIRADSIFYPLVVQRFISDEERVQSLELAHFLKTYLSGCLGLAFI